MEKALQKQVKLDIKKKPSGLSEEFDDMKLKLESITEMFYTLRKRFNGKNKNKSEDIKKNTDVYNKDGVPLNSSFIGFTKNSNFPFVLIVDDVGNYKVGQKTFKSLSSSAEYVSGVRRSGWTFWKLIDGRTLKDVYKVK